MLYVIIQKNVASVRGMERFQEVAKRPSVNYVMDQEDVFIVFTKMIAEAGVIIKGDSNGRRKEMSCLFRKQKVRVL